MHWLKWIFEVVLIFSFLIEPSFHSQLKRLIKGDQRYFARWEVAGVPIVGTRQPELHFWFPLRELHYGDTSVRIDFVTELAKRNGARLTEEQVYFWRIRRGNVKHRVVY